MKNRPSIFWLCIVQSFKMLLKSTKLFHVLLLKIKTGFKCVCNGWKTSIFFFLENIYIHIYVYTYILAMSSRADLGFVRFTLL